MIVCNNCAKLGRPLGPAVPAQGRVSPMQNAIRTMAQRPIQPIDVEFEVDPEYNLKIRQAREKLGLSQEQLGQLLNEKPSVIKMVESRKLKPDLTLTRKFMHQLKINLLVSLSELEGGRPTGI
jgi:uncharacterized protein (TIGR00270 family)